MPQLAVPVSDISVGAWTRDDAGTPLYLALEVPNQNADYILCPGNQDSACECALDPLTDPLTSTGHIVRYSYRKEATGGDPRNLLVQLVQGTTVIAQQDHLDIPGDSWQDAALTLSGAQADSITDYTNLRLRFTTHDLSADDFREVWVGWCDLEVPAVERFAQGNATLPFTGTGTAGVQVAGMGNRPLPFAGSGTAAVGIAGAGAGALPFLGQGTITVAITGAGDAPLPFTGSGSAVVTNDAYNAEGNAQLPLTGAGEATVETHGAGDGALPFLGAGAAAVESHAVGDGQLPWAGAGQGAVSDNRVAAGNAALVLSGQGAATVETHAQGQGALPFAGASTATTEDPFPFTLTRRHGDVRPVYRADPK